MGRWVMFTWTCRAFAVFGEKILPVLQERSLFFRFSGMSLVFERRCSTGDVSGA